MILIEAANINKSFGSTAAVQDLNLQIAAGEIYGLVGPDGAGKTTSLRLLCGALTPTSAPQAQPAAIRIAGYDLLRQTEFARAQIGYLAQRFSLYEDLTVLENIRFFAEVRGLSASAWRPRCMQILEFVGLAGFIDRRAGQLSGGMKQKLGLAAALVHQPRVLLLDEPTTGVDPVTRQDFWQLIIRLVGAADHATAVLVSTPYMDEAARCTRLGMMQRGRLALEGTPAELCQRMNGQIVELAGEPLALLRRLVEAEPQVVDVRMFGDRLHLRVQAGAAKAVITRLSKTLPAQGGRISRLRSIPPQLEDVFMGLLEARQ
jgi:ABC-2 type transport system ATP-binding protein